MDGSCPSDPDMARGGVGAGRTDGGNSRRGEKRLERLRLCFEVGQLEFLLDWVWSMRRADSDTDVFGLRKWQDRMASNRSGGGCIARRTGQELVGGRISS